MKTGRRVARSAAGQDRSSRTRAALVDGAISALHDVGFAGCSAREIAQRAGCSQGLVFYHFGSVTELLLAALDDISARRLTAYRSLLDGRRRSTAELVEAARLIFTEDLDAGHVRVLAEMITGAQSIPGLGEQVAQRLQPWRQFTETVVASAAPSSVGLLLPTREIAHAIVAGFLGLELLATLDGDRAAALALFDRAALVAALFDRVDPPALITDRTEDSP